MLISNNSRGRKEYFDFDIIKKENAWILQCLQIDTFEADVVRSLYQFSVSTRLFRKRKVGSSASNFLPFL